MMTLEKNYKIIFFVEKNEAQISGFAVAKKSPKSFKKAIFRKKFLPAYLCRYDSKWCAEFFFKQMGLKIFKFR